MKSPTAWLVSRKDGQAERYIQLELPVVGQILPQRQVLDLLCNFVLATVLKKLTQLKRLPDIEIHCLYFANDSLIFQLNQASGRVIKRAITDENWPK